MGEILQLIAAGLPYDTLMKKNGNAAPARRGSVMKLLGDASLLPNAANFSSALASGIGGGGGVHSSGGMSGKNSRRQSIIKCGLEELSYHSQVLSPSSQSQL